MKTPATITLDELAKSASAAGAKADRQARDAGIDVAGREKGQGKKETAVRKIQKSA